MEFAAKIANKAGGQEGKKARRKVKRGKK